MRVPPREPEFGTQLLLDFRDNVLRSVESTGATCVSPYASTESVCRQNCQPNITVEENAHAAGREFPLPSDGSFLGDGRTWLARGPIHSQSKTGSHTPVWPDRPGGVGFLRSIRSRSRVKLISGWHPPQSGKWWRKLVRLFACGLSLSFCQIHFVDFSVQRAAADAEFFGGGGDIAVRRSERLGNQSSFGLVQIERAGFFAERLGW
jgi:hypothetical protein